MANTHRQAVKRRQLKELCDHPNTRCRRMVDVKSGETTLYCNNCGALARRVKGRDVWSYPG